MTLPKLNKLFYSFIRPALALLIALVLLILPSLPTTATASTFVDAQGTQLTLNGKPYRFTGVNAYQLATLWGTNPGCGSQVNDLDTFFSNLRPNSVVRLWAFQGSIGTNVQTKQTDFAPLDRIVTAAEKHGQKLIMAIAGQSGTCDDGHWKDKAWYSGGFREVYNDDGRAMAPLSFLEYTKLVVNRYKNSPAIAMWEPVSEAEATQCAPGYTDDDCYKHASCPDFSSAAKALRYFFDTVGGEIKRIDPNHLVESGVLGASQCGVHDKDYLYVHQSPGIDVASFHDYEPGNKPMPGDQWNGLQTRLNQMKSINKPLVVGEVGINALNNTTNCTNLTSRRDLIRAKMDAQFKAGIVGFLPWNWQEKASTTCNHDLSSGDPMLTLINTYSVPASTLTPTPTPPTKLSPRPEADRPLDETPTSLKKLGGLNLSGYCASLKKEDARITSGNWMCGTQDQNINMSSVCIWQYKDQDAFAKQDIVSNQYSWTCYVGSTSLASTPSPATKLGGLDLSRYCSFLQLPGAVMSGSNWTCGSGGSVISMTNACRWYYKDLQAYAKQITSGNPYTWSCYK